MGKEEDVLRIMLKPWETEDTMINYDEYAKLRGGGLFWISGYAVMLFIVYEYLIYGVKLGDKFEILLMVSLLMLFVSLLAYYAKYIKILKDFVIRTEKTTENVRNSLILSHTEEIEKFKAELKELKFNHEKELEIRQNDRQKAIDDIYSRYRGIITQLEEGKSDLEKYIDSKKSDLLRIKNAFHSLNEASRLNLIEFKKGTVEDTDGNIEEVGDIKNALKLLKEAIDSVTL